MSQQMTKTQYEVIAAAIAAEARPILVNLRGYKVTNPQRAAKECAMDSKLQTLWSVSLSMANHLSRYAKFDRTKFLELCGTSPQNWRFMNWYIAPTKSMMGNRIVYMNDDEAKKMGYFPRKQDLTE